MADAPEQTEQDRFAAALAAMDEPAPEPAAPPAAETPVAVPAEPAIAAATPPETPSESMTTLMRRLADQDRELTQLRPLRKQIKDGVRPTVDQAVDVLRQHPESLGAVLDALMPPTATLPAAGAAAETPGDPRVTQLEERFAQLSKRYEDEILARASREEIDRIGQIVSGDAARWPLLRTAGRSALEAALNEQAELHARDVRDVPYEQILDELERGSRERTMATLKSLTADEKLRALIYEALGTAAPSSVATPPHAATPPGSPPAAPRATPKTLDEMSSEERFAEALRVFEQG